MGVNVAANRHHKNFRCGSPGDVLRHLFHVLDGLKFEDTCGYCHLGQAALHPTKRTIYKDMDVAEYNWYRMAQASGRKRIAFTDADSVGRKGA